MAAEFGGHFLGVLSKKYVAIVFIFTGFEFYFLTFHELHQISIFVDFCSTVLALCVLPLGENFNLQLFSIFLLISP